MCMTIRNESINNIRTASQFIPNYQTWTFSIESSILVFQICTFRTPIRKLFRSLAIYLYVYMYMFSCICITYTLSFVYMYMFSSICICTYTVSFGVPKLQFYEHFCTCTSARFQPTTPAWFQSTLSVPG
jgi:hypothetical protein